MTLAPPRRIRVEDISGIRVVSFAEKRILEADVVRQVGEELHALLRCHDPNRVVLNLGGVRLMTSALLCVLIRLKQSVESTGGALKLCCVPPEVRPLFRWCRVEFAIHVEEQEALDSF